MNINGNTGDPTVLNNNNNSNNSNNNNNSNNMNMIQLPGPGQYRLTQTTHGILQVTPNGVLITAVTLRRHQLITILDSNLNNPYWVMGTYDPELPNVPNAYILINASLASRLRPLGPNNVGPNNVGPNNGLDPNSLNGGKRKQGKTRKQRKTRKQKSNRKSRRARN